MDAYKLKWIAVAGMIANHAVFALYEILPLWLMFPLYAAGGLTFPILAYFVVEGYKHTSNIKKYILRLFIFGLIAVPFHLLVFEMFMPNIMFTIILSLIALILHDKIKIRLLFGPVFALLLMVSAVLMMDWPIIGPVVVMLYYKIRDGRARRVVPSVVAGVFMLASSLMAILGLTLNGGAELMEAKVGGLAMYGDINYWIVSTTFIIGCVLAGILLKGFNGERGKRMKWAFYIAYPLHLAVLGLVSLALGLVYF